MEEGHSRTIEGIQKDFAKVQEEINQTKKKGNIIKQQNNSVCGQPLLPSIPLENICPPALHCCMALCNKLRLFSKSEKFEKFIKYLNIKPIAGRDEYNGNACRKILQKFRKKPQEYDGPHKSLFITVANLECLAKAEPLKAAEVKLLKNLIDDLRNQLKEVPSFKVGNKIHAVLFHLHRFVVQEGSWGLFAEQGMEAIHAKFTELEKRKFSLKVGKLKYAFYEMLKMTFVREM